MQWPCNEKAPDGTPVMHIDGFVRGKGKFIRHRICADRRAHRAALPAAAHHRPHPSQYNVGAQTRRTENVVWHARGPARDPSARRRAARHPRRRLGAADRAAPARRTLRALITERVAPGVVYTTFHHPDTQANVITTDFSDWATNCPEYKVTAVQVAPSNGPTRLAGRYDDAGPPEPPHRAGGSRGVRHAAPGLFSETAGLARRRRQHRHAPIPEETPSRSPMTAAPTP